VIWSHLLLWAAGGYTTAKAPVVGLLRQKSRPYLFSNTLAPAVAAASITVFDLLTQSHELRDKLQHNTDYFRREMGAAGFSIRPGNHPIVVSRWHAGAGGQGPGGRGQGAIKGDRAGG
jgi:7-keto-8-aminopelargonate synthetase-like enzyme